MNIGKLLLELQPYLVPIKDIFTIISLCVAAIVAISGLQAWKKQLHGTQAYDLAKRILTNVYTLRDAFKLAIFGYSEREANLAKMVTKIETSLEDPLYEIKTIDAVSKVRWKKLEETHRNLGVESIEAEALWGTRAKSVIWNMCQLVKARQNMIETYIDEMYSRKSSTDLDPRLEKIKNRLFWTPDHFEGGEFLNQLDLCTSLVEKIVFPYITKKSIKKVKKWKLPWNKNKG